MPSDYDTYLTIAFGDYKTLPPESQRMCHHEHEWIDTEHSYQIYRGKKYVVKSKRHFLPSKKHSEKVKQNERAKRAGLAGHTKEIDGDSAGI